jgi:PAS domain-containing protein
LGIEKMEKLIIRQLDQVLRDTLEEAERLAASHDGIREAIITVDPENRIRSLNSGAESLTGWLQAEAFGLPLAKVCELAGLGRCSFEDLAFTAETEHRKVALPLGWWVFSRNGRAWPRRQFFARRTHGPHPSSVREGRPPPRSTAACPERDRHRPRSPSSQRRPTTPRTD